MLKAMAAGAAGLLVLAGGGAWAFDAAAPSDRIINGWRVWHCGGLGGSWTVESPIDWKLQRGLRRGTFGLIGAETVSVAAVELTGADGRRLGVAAWIQYSRTPGEVGALNALARRVSEVDSTLREDDYRAEIRAAAEGGRRRVRL